MSTLASNLKIFRERNHFSQETVGNFLGLKREVVSYYETGVREPAFEHLEKLADLYCAEIADFYEEDAQEKMVNFAFAFRAGEFSTADLEAIAKFKRIIRNYLKLKKYQNILK